MSKFIRDTSGKDFRSFPKHSFEVQHDLQDNMLLQMESILELSRELPECSVEYNASDLPVYQDPTLTPTTGLSVQETIERIESCNSWLVLKNVQQSSRFNELLDTCVENVAAQLGQDPMLFRGRQAFVFVSSPGSVTPMHIDPEHNFLLQIRGSKTVHIWDPTDRVVVTERQLEAFHSGAHRNLPYQETFAERASVHTLKPGDGLHFPVTAPHWVQNGPDVSISFSITFRSRESERAARLYRTNAAIRKLGMRPTPVGRSPRMELAKDLSYRMIRKSASLLGNPWQA